MRDCNIVTNTNEDIAPDDESSSLKTTYSEVVIIGNGPSGITLSYILSGHNPYYNRTAHPDPMLSARLIECTQKSLLYQDLHFLSLGIEGRSKNPVSVLIDAMNHPGADLGLEWKSLLTWKKTNKTMEHVVLGRGQPGGTWQGIPDNVLTISPGRWMALPGLPFTECKEGRAPASAVARYYREYVAKNELEKNFVQNTTVTMIHPIAPSVKRKARWRVWITDSDNKTSCYECRHLVLATGASDRAGCLGVTGESLQFVTHDLKTLEDIFETKRVRTLPTKQSFIKTRSISAIENVLVNNNQQLPFKFKRSKSSNESFNVLEDVLMNDNNWRDEGKKRRSSFSELCIEDNETKLPVLVVGAGLSAADAIILARKMKYPVIHAFRSAHVPNQLGLSASLYPEYHEVSQLMQGSVTSSDYSSLPGFQVTSFQENNTVHLKNGLGEEKSFKITAAAILIGSQPDLSFLPRKLRHLGVNPNKPVDCKSNPIQIDMSYKCLRAHPGLYALGPLVGDNFVRLLQGGAIAVASSIFKESALQNS